MYIRACGCTCVSFLIACRLFAVSKWDQSHEDKSGSAVICLEMSGSGWDQPSDQRHTKEIYPWEKLQQKGFNGHFDFLVPSFSSVKSSVPGKYLPHKPYYFFKRTMFVGVINKGEFKQGELNECKKTAFISSFTEERKLKLMLSDLYVLLLFWDFCSLSDVSIGVNISRKFLFKLHGAIK